MTFYEAEYKAKTYILNQKWAVGQLNNFWTEWMKMMIKIEIQGQDAVLATEEMLAINGLQGSY